MLSAMTLCQMQNYSGIWASEAPCPLNILNLFSLKGESGYEYPSNLFLKGLSYH
jgi:hypothetical protein